MSAGFQDKPSIVVVGAFNPTIIQLEWLVDQGIVPGVKAEEANAQINFGDPIQYRFACGGSMWTVSKRRLMLEAASDEDSPARLMQDVLRILKHTPVSSIGINLLTTVHASAWKAEVPCLPEEFVSAANDFGDIASRTFALTIASSTGTVLNLSLAIEGSTYTINQNHHHSVSDVAHAIEIVGTYAAVLAEAKTRARRMSNGDLP